ncbi:hypothetical protein [Flavobacterium limicola]|uniref:hypothetical protein n=1 Tax=Flavobacterium limicola TaxID=180441 RepID=UPI000EB29BA0|nr:hypothetical protein [Flavobacterium limicola]
MHNYYQNDGYRYKTYSSGHVSFNAIEFINSLRNNKKLKIVFLGVLILAIVLVIGIIAILFSLISSMTDNIAPNGLPRVFDEAIDFLNRLWNGTE